ncbi:MAG: BON domain-containing protein [Bacteroidetes bacterium]|nr:BON domain-containing protein [Bacteroidota bacterium]
MKKHFTFLLMIAAITIGFTACKSKPKDADIKAAVEKALSADPMSAGTTVAVDKGVVTLSGECKDEMCKKHCEEMTAAIKDVKSVVNNCTVAAPPPPPSQEANPVVANEQAIMDALKDQPGLKGMMKDGKIVLSGEIAKAKWQMLKQTLDKLKPAGYDLTGLKIK